MARKIDPRIKELKYYLMSGVPDFDSLELEIYNKAYIYWRDFWNKVFRDNGTLDTVNADTFMRQSLVSFLMHDNNIVGMHLYSKFDTRQVPTLEHSYIISSFNTQFIEELRSRNVHRAVSLEYLTVDKAWRKNEIGISLASIFLGLAVKIVKMLGGQVAVGPTRSDLKVTELVRDFGGEPLISGVYLHNTPCDLSTIFVNQAKPHPDQTINEYINFFWENKIHLDQQRGNPALLNVA